MTPPSPAAAPSNSRVPVVRSRLLAGLQQRSRLRVVAVVAGAGFGKTTLVGQALAEGRLSGARDAPLTCTPDHAAASVLVDDMLAALGGPAPHELPTDPDAGARLVSDAVWGLAPAEVVLVVDDVHLLPEDSPGRRLLAALVERLPRNGHLVVAGRPPAPFPLARLQAAGQALLLTEADLAFSGDELADFATTRGIDPALLQGVSGWPALAELVATTGHAQVSDYLWEEVLRGLSPERVQALTVISAVGGADAGLLHELLGRPADPAALVGDLPLVSVVDGRWMVHPLWAEALRGRPRDELSDATDAAVAAAPAALRRRGWWRQSMRLLLDRQAWPEVMEVLVEACAGITPSVPVDVLSTWLARLPDQVRVAPAGLLLAATVTKGDDPWAARTMLLTAADGFASTGDRAGEMACLVSLFHIAFWRNEIGEMRPVLRRWHELAEEGDMAAANAASLGRALLAADPAAARVELHRLPAQSTGPMTVLVGWIRAHLLLLTLGEPERAATWAREALPIAPSTLRGSIRCELVESLRLLGRGDEALAELPAMLADQPDAAVRSPRPLVVGVVLHAFRGDLAGARALLPDLRAVTEHSHLPWAGIADAVARAAVAVSEGRESEAAELVRGVADDALALPLVILRVSPAALPLQYVLDPRARATWDGLELHGVLDLLRRLARAVVAAQSGDPLPGLGDGDVSAAAGLLPVPWVTLLAAGLAARNREEGALVIQRLGPLARPTLHDLAATTGPLAAVATPMLAVIPSVPRHHLDLRVLGPLVLLRDGAEPDDANYRRARVRQLLGHLAVRRSASRHDLTAALWPDLGDTEGSRNLRVTLNYLQRLLEPDRDERDAPFFLRARGSVLELVTDDALSVDLWRFEAALTEAEQAEAAGTPSLALAAYERALAAYGGDLLADQPTETWLEQPRERERRRLLRAALRAGQLLLAGGSPDRAEELAARAMEVEPWSEEAYRIQVAALLARGDRAAAQRALDRTFAMLDEMGVAATRETFDLAAQVRGR